MVMAAYVSTAETDLCIGGSEQISWSRHGKVPPRALSQALGRRKSFQYLYDFGDAWWHKVKVKRVVRLDSPIEYAQCIAGENACPPEDVGGAGGYEEFLKALADPAHPEHAELKRWIGRPFDPRAFDINEINVRLNARE